MRPRRGSAAVCSRCHRTATGYDQLPERRFEFIPFFGFRVFYSMRRVDCGRCRAVLVEEVPWGDGKRTLTKAYIPASEKTFILTIGRYTAVYQPKPATIRTGRSPLIQGENQRYTKPCMSTDLSRADMCTTSLPKAKVIRLARERRPRHCQRFRSANPQESTPRPCRRGTAFCQG